MEICKKNVLLYIYLGVLMFLFSQVSHVSSATDTISTNTPLAGYRTLISRSDVFELGLFNLTTGNNRYVYIGMWYKQVSPRSFVWVANRESPARDIGIPDCLLKIAEGNLILHGNHEAIWSTGVKSSRSKDDVQAVLLDNGNLVLRDGPNSSAAVLWQSFDHPSDTWLPGAKLKLGSQLLTSWKSLTDPSPGPYSLEFDHHSNSLITVWNGSKSYSSSGPWDDRFKNFKGFQIPDRNWNFQRNLNDSYISYSVGPSTYRLFMDTSGQLMVKAWDEVKQSWYVIWSQPNKRCAVYNYCGSFAICDENQEQVSCRCVPGFRQATDDPNDFSGGCEKETKLQCGKGNDKFLPTKNMKLATDPATTLGLTVTKCASACLAHCSCQAYAYDGNKCLIWEGDVFNLQQIDANKGHTFFLRVAALNISPTASNISPATSNQDKHIQYIKKIKK